MKLSLSRNDIGPIVLILIASICYVFDDALRSAFIYHHSSVAKGQVWRLVTGNLLHSNLYHFLLNSAGVAMLMFLHSQHYTWRRYAAVMLVCCLITSMSIYVLNPEMHRYVGLSGALHGLFTWGAIKDIQKGWLSGYLLLIGIIVKVIWEQIYGASEDLASLIESSVAIDAHLYGMAGMLIAMSPSLLRTLRIDLTNYRKR